MRLILSAIAACLLASQANANGCRAQKVVVQEVAQVVAPVYPIIQAIQIPLYSYSYAPPVYAPPPQQPVYQQPQQQVYQPPQQPVQQQAEVVPQIDCCTALIQELAKLRAEIAALRGAPPIAGLPPVQAPPVGGAPPVVGSVLQSRCAACHGATNPKGEFALFLADGKRAPLSLQQKNRIKRRAILTSDMPAAVPGQPHQPLSQAEKDALTKELETP